MNISNTFNVNFHGNFRPLICETYCPKSILNNINEYVDNLTEESLENYKKVFGNLLYRDIPNIFISETKSVEWGLKSYLEDVSKKYLEFNKINFNCEIPHSSCFGNGEYLDIWVNRYHLSSDYTPLHIHCDCSISGVIILKISEKLNSVDSYRMDGKLQFLIPDNNYISTYSPIQNLGKIILFPSWIQHLVYPQKINDERRTLSFNVKFVDKK